MNSPHIAAYPCRKFHDNAWHEIEDTIPQEVRINLTWPGKQTTLWAFPHDLEMLAIGHALVEWSSPGQIPVIDQVNQTTYVLTPCSHEYPGNRSKAFSISPRTLLSAMDLFFSRPGMWETTGCFHRMALLDPKRTTIEHFVEDIARHNCVDRLAGWSVQTERSLGDLALLCSCRVTGSLMRKIIHLNLPMVVSRSATTMGAIEQAKDHGVTLVGFSRNTRFTVFCDPNTMLPAGKN
jgi:FdhD protein